VATGGDLRLLFQRPSVAEVSRCPVSEETPVDLSPVYHARLAVPNWSIAFIVLVQLNYAIAPRIGKRRE